MTTLSNNAKTEKKCVVVIGAGVIGLSTAVLLAEHFGVDVEVRVVADRFTPETTSNVAGGLWSPQFSRAPSESPLQQQRKRTWARQTYQHGQEVARSPEASRAGIFLIQYYKVYYWTENQADHWWRDVVLNYRRVSDREREVLFPGTKDAYAFTSTVTDCSLFLPYLTDRFLKAGGTITRRKVSSLLEFVGKCDLLVNCSGLGARDVAADPEVQPARGQVLQVDAPWVHYATEVEPPKNSSKWSYIIPRVRDVVVGGTSQRGRWDTAVDDEDTKNILEDVGQFMPSLKGARVKGRTVGLRPFRESGVRLEKETIHNVNGTLQVVHNYGHSGNGITIYWGCAKEASAIVTDLLSRQLTSKL